MSDDTQKDTAPGRAWQPKEPFSEVLTPAHLPSEHEMLVKAERDRYRVERDRFRAALVAIVGTDDRDELQAMKIVMAYFPAGDSRNVTGAAIDALLGIPEDA